MEVSVFNSSPAVLDFNWLYLVHKVRSPLLLNSSQNGCPCGTKQECAREDQNDIESLPRELFLCRGRFSFYLYRSQKVQISSWPSSVPSSNYQMPKVFGKSCYDPGTCLTSSLQFNQTVKIKCLASTIL